MVCLTFKDTAVATAADINLERPSGQIARTSRLFICQIFKNSRRQVSRALSSSSGIVGLCLQALPS